ncbi:putative nuclease HARBI1 isoform X2 [Ornithodoros turicata]|uniref:putative nuclease HARBI1 isoform X2 n=1 Tax=Ornithodoros turicata TaxID=34597 RepID=UPI00313A3374
MLFIPFTCSQCAQQSRQTTLSVERRVLIALRFYATGATLWNIAREDTIACSRHAVSEAIHEVTQAILKNLAPKYLRFPTTAEQKLQVKSGFHELAGFPGCVGAMDGTHVEIMQPSLSDPRCRDYNYYCREGFHSLNVLMVCDAARRILFLNARFPGSCHDAYIWSVCNLREAATTVFEEGEWLVGDSDYPLQPWLMTPVPSPTAQDEQSYNDAHNRARACIERCITELKVRFQCLHRRRPLHFAPGRCCSIINACAVVHNMCVAYNIREPFANAGEEAEDDATEEESSEEENDDPEPMRNRAAEVRSQLIARDFRQNQ